MRLFNLIQMKYNEYSSAVRDFISKQLSSKNTRYGNATIFGQLLNVIGSVTQNMLSYIEDALTEQNRYTAQRRRSIYNLAQLSGYAPSTGKSASANITMTFKPNNDNVGNIIIPNHTRLSCSNNNKTYAIILQQESIILNQSINRGMNSMAIVEGVFETQTFISNGGKLYSQHVEVNNDTDVEYMRVWVNDTEYRMVDSIYDMSPDEKAYVVNQSIHRGFVLTFGNTVHGHQLSENDTIKVEYLKHSGESGNIDMSRNCQFTFIDDLYNSDGEIFDGNEIFNIELDVQFGVTSGTNAESVEDVRSMIGYNSRSLVLADAKNYEMMLNRFSFVGYNKTWSVPGTMMIRSMVIRNYNDIIPRGRDYFTLSESDFLLSDMQRNSIIRHVVKSGAQLAGSVYEIQDPQLCKYAMYCYVKMKTGNFNEIYTMSNIRDAVGMFFSNIKNDNFVPKSDLVKVILDSDSGIDSVDIYFVSERNERAIIDGYYEREYTVTNPAVVNRTGTKETIYVYQGEDPGLGLDEHGNILLDNEYQYPVLMGGWSYRPDSSSDVQVSVTDPLNITIM